MKVLFTTPILEHPPAGGPQLRIDTSIKALSRVSELFIVSRNPEYLLGGQAGENHFKAFCSEFTYAPSARLSGSRYVRKIQKVFRRILRINDDAKYIIEFAEQRDIQIIWFGYGNISYPLINRIKQLRPGLKVVCDTDSVWSRYVLRELPYESDPIRRAQIEKEGLAKECEERAGVNLCEITTAVSEVDAEYYRALAPTPRKIQIFSNVIDVDTYLNHPSPPDDLKLPCIYLAGSFSPQSPMDMAARWVLHEVFPTIRAQIPNVHFYILGRGSKEVLSDIFDPNVTILGKVPSALPYLCHADVALVPLKFESGTRFKILEAGACGIPVVSTVLGAEGIPVTNGKDILLKDDPKGFAEAIIYVLKNKDKARKMSANLRDLIVSNYSIQTLQREAHQILKALEAPKDIN